MSGGRVAIVDLGLFLLDATAGDGGLRAALVQIRLRYLITARQVLQTGDFPLLLGGQAVALHRRPVPGEPTD